MLQLLSVVNEEQSRFENIGISRIVAFLEQNDIKVKMAFINFEDLENEIKKIDYECDMFGFSAYNQNINYIFEMARRIKSKNKKSIIFVGSKFASASSKMILEESNDIDFVILGNGEYPILEFINLYSSGKKLNKIYATHPNIIARGYVSNKIECNTDINTLVWPKRTSKLNSYNNFAFICTSNNYKDDPFYDLSNRNNKWNGRGAEDIYNEIITIFKKWGVRFFVFTDENLEEHGDLGKNRIKNLCKLLIKYPVKLSFRCSLRADSFKDIESDNEILKLMCEAGFANIFLDIDAANEKDLLLYEKKAKLTDNDIALGLMKKNGINALYSFIIINPYSNENSIEDNFKFLSRHKSSQLNHYINILKVHHNTPIYYKLKKDNLLKKDFCYKNIFDYKFLNPFANEVFDFIQNYIVRSVIFQYSTDCYNLIHLYNNLNFFGYISAELDVQFKDIKEEVFFCLNDYFNSIYINHNISLSRFQVFEKNLVKLYEIMRVVQMKFTKQIIKYL